MSTTDLNERLLTGERILWSGRPGQGLLLTGRDALLIPFSLMWGGFAIFWEATALTQPNTQPFFGLWGIPFVLIALYLVAGRFLLDAWIRGGMVYAVTNRRILISRSGPFGKLTALSLDRLPDASISESAGGRGTIRFGEPVPFWGGRNSISSWTPSLDPTPQFIAIENARSVFDQIQLATRGGGLSSPGLSSPGLSR
jgi:hypothetical protein